MFPAAMRPSREASKLLLIVGRSISATTHRYLTLNHELPCPRLMSSTVTTLLPVIERPFLADGTSSLFVGVLDRYTRTTTLSSLPTNFDIDLPSMFSTATMMHPAIRRPSQAASKLLTLKHLGALDRCTRATSHNLTPNCHFDPLYDVHSDNNADGPYTSILGGG